MSKDRLPGHHENLLYALEHGLLDDELGESIRTILELGIDDGFAAEEMLGRVGKHKIAQAYAGPIARACLDNGDVILGFDPAGRPIRTWAQNLNGHSLTLGNTGAAKTTKTRFVVAQVARRVEGLWLFDFRKREFGVLHPYLKVMGVDLCIVSTRDMRFNPLQVPFGTHPAAYAPRVADLLVHVLELPPRATKLIHTTILRLYQNSGVFDGAQTYPTLSHLRDAVANDKTANPPARQALVDSIDPVLASLGPEVLGHHVGWSTHDLAARAIVFELSDAAECDKDLILNFLLESEFMSRIARQISNPKMDLYIACDEAASLVSASAGSIGLAQRIGLIRGTGIGLDLSVQSGDIAPSVLSNTSIKYIGRCGSARDYDLIGGAMGLTAEQRQWLSLHLRPGLFVAQLGEGDYRRPFQLEVPNLRFPHPGSHSPQLGDLASLPLVPAGTHPITHVIGNVPAPAAVPASTSILSDREVRYLTAVLRHPGQPSHLYAKLASMNARRAGLVRRDLVARGLLREHRVQTGTRGRGAVILEPLQPAIRALEQLGVLPEDGTP